MIDTLLRNADPARTVTPDADTPEARALLARVLATSHEQPRAVRGDARRRSIRRRSVRRIAIGGVLAGAAATVALAAPMPWNDGAGTSSAAFAVTVEGGGAVRVSIHWDELTDPAALQAALDHADAHVRVRIDTATGSGSDGCSGGISVEYTDRAVQYLSPGAADGGFLVRPKLFPADATFVLTVVMAPAGVSGLSTMPPGHPQIESWGASMMRNPVPTCR